MQIKTKNKKEVLVALLGTLGQLKLADQKTVGNAMLQVIFYHRLGELEDE